MCTEAVQIGGKLVLVCDEAGTPPASEANAVDIIGSTWGQEIDWMAIPVGRLAASFLDLRTGLAGAVIQKFVTPSSATADRRRHRGCAGDQQGAAGFRPRVQCRRSGLVRAGPQGA